MKEVTYKICPDCGGKMTLQTGSSVFQVDGKEIEIRGIKVFKCENCGEEVFTSKEAHMIENLIRSFEAKPVPTPFVLNLAETAEYLRVSNQTVYNMIRDGRIKAHKVGREWRFLQADIQAYLNSISSIEMAAKGGTADAGDIAVIVGELEKGKTDNE
jgi:excisionase family DNA binding protein/YgiT-type zinc finger domain-containing protein